MKKSLAVTIALLIGMGGIFVSQSYAEEGEEENYNDFILEEVVVTAQKREENLQDVPISITAISEGRLEQLGAREIADVQNFAPNVDFGNTLTNDNPSIRIRGIRTSASNIGFEAGFGVYVDGVYMGRNSALNQTLADVALMEVLRGPQGTLFGKNTTVGAFNITTRRPSEDLELNVQVEAGNYNLKRARGHISGPIVADKLFGKITLFKDLWDGFYENLNPGTHDAVDEDQIGGRGELRYTPTDDLDIALRFDHAYSDRYAIPWNIDDTDPHLFPHPIFGVVLPVNFPGNNPGTISQDDTSEERTIEGTSLTMDYGFGDGYSLTSISALRGLEVQIQGDMDSTAYDILGIDLISEYTQLTQELRITSPAGRKLEYVAGLYFYSQDAKSIADTIALGVVFPFGPWPTVNSATIRINTEVDTKSAAVFLDGRYALTDRFKLLFGARYTQEEKDLKMKQQGVFMFFPDIATFTDSRSDQEISPTVGLSFSASDNVTMYGRVARGFKSGGWNSSMIGYSVLLPSGAPDVAKMSFNPEFMTSYEVGMKSELFDHRLRLNTAMFYTDYEDMQLRIYRGIEGEITANAGEARSMGFELEIDAMPTNNLRITAGLGYADAEYTKLDLDDSVPGNQNGQRMPGPKWSTNLNLTYTIPMSFGEIIGGVDYSYKTKSFGSANDPEETEFGSSELINARLSMNIFDSWQIAAWGKNLMDKENVIARIGDYNLELVRMDVVNYGAPRTFGLTVTYNY
ncbi:MAG: TonB-dependent receptor [Deltaproteobacteria bacterium]|nr:TonB-dependent receptor [Deltaproteobacteria bacterium]